MIPVLLLGCGGTLTARDLEGIWSNADDLQRVIAIERLDEVAAQGSEHGFTFYLYDPGDEPVVVQSGLFAVYEEEAIYDVRWDVDPFNVGVRFADEVERISRKVTRFGDREYDRVDAVPPGVERDYVFGEAIEGIDHRGQGHGLTMLDDGSTWGFGTDIALPYATGMGANGEALGSFPIDFRAFSAPVSQGMDLGWIDQTTAAVGRYTLEFVPAEDAFSPPRVDPVPVWVSEERCWRLVETADRWVATCDPSQGTTTEGLEALVVFDPADGSVLDAWPLFGTSSSSAPLVAVGDDVVVEVSGPSPTPDLHGPRGDQGVVLERRGLDGTSRWTLWSPHPSGMRGAVELEDGTTVLLLGGAGEFPGGETGSSGDARALAVTPEGDLAWQTPLPRPEGGHQGDLVAVPGGFAVAIGAGGQDLGGAVGVIDGSGSQDPAIVAYDTCGVAVDAAVFESCNPECGGALLSDPANAVFTDLVRDRDGHLVTQLVSNQYYQWGHDVTSTAGMVRVAPPDALPACTAEPPPTPELTLTLSGDATVTLGDTSCTTDCTVDAVRFEAIPVEVTPAPGWQVLTVTGACTEVPCTVYADRVSQSLDITLIDTGFQPIETTHRVDALTGAETVAFAVGFLPFDAQAFDGVVVADRANGESGYVAALDASGVVASHAFPEVAGGPVFTDLRAQPGTDTVALLLQSGTVHTYDPTGGISAPMPLTGTHWRQVALGTGGELVVAGTASTQLDVAAVDGSWAHGWGTGSGPMVLDLVARDSGGFTVVAAPFGSLDIDGTVYTGGLGDKVRVDLTAAGLVENVAFVPGYGGLPPESAAWDVGGELWMSTAVSLDPTAPTGASYVERIAPDGTVLEVVATQTAEPLVPWSGGWAGSGLLYSATDPFGGPDLPHVGGADLFVGWIDAAGTPLGAASTGTLGDDFRFPDGFAVRQDGTAFLVVASPTGPGIAVFSLP